MPKTKISEFDTNPDNNTDINSINIAEGCAPSGINNAIRQLMADLKEFQTGASGDSFTVGGAFSANGGATLGDASGDALTINSSAASIPNGLAFSGGNIGIANNLNFTGTGNRITGDFSNATIANRVMFQSGTSNGNTIVYAIPNGTAQLAAFTVANTSGATNGSRGSLVIDNSVVRIESELIGTGSYLPLAIWTGGSERLRIDTSGNVGIGLTTSAWNTAGAGKAIQLANSSNAGAARASAVASWYGAVGIMNDCYYGTDNNWKYYSGQTPALYEQAAGSHIWSSAGQGTANNTITFSERMRIDSSGRVGIGTTNISAPLTVQTSSGIGIDVVGQANDIAQIRLNNQANNGTRAFFYSDNSATAIGTSTALPFLISTNGTERMRIDSSGNLLVGTTSQFNSPARIAVSLTPGGVQNGIQMRPTNNNTYYPMLFENNGGSTVGYIQAGATSTSYVTSSDYRLKENIAPMQGALDLVQQLKPVTYTWKADGSEGQGFIAHELQAVVPDCVTGEKDAVDAEGNPQYQGIDTSFLVATLTAAIQELKGIVDAQKAELDTVKAELNTLKGN